MADKVFEFQQSKDRKVIFTDTYRPLGTRKMPEFFPAFLLLMAIATLVFGLMDVDAEDRKLAVVCALSLGAIAAAMGRIWWQAAEMNRLRARETEAALRDYPWDRERFVVNGRAELKSSLAWAVLMTPIILVPTVWSFREMNDSFFSWHLLVLALDLLLLWLWSRALRLCVSAWKFGASQVEFLCFPYSIRKPVRLRWVVPRNVVEPREARFVLRCIHEHTVHFMKDGKRTSTREQEECWAGEWRLVRPVAWRQGEQIELEWEPPSSLPGTALNGEELFFWRFDVRVNLSGADFSAIYLIPVYE